MPAPGESKVSAVVAHMQTLISTGRVATGDRLPSERSLSQELGVSRAVVREALAALDLAGLIDRRTGDGAYLLESGGSGAKGGSVRIASGLKLVDTLELRMNLEVAAVSLACHRARSSDVLKLQACLQAMTEQAEDGEYELYLQATMDLHVALARAARSEPLSEVLLPLAESARRDQWLLAEHFSDDLARARLEDHAEIVDAVVRRDVAGAVETVMTHYADCPVIGEKAVSVQD